MNIDDLDRTLADWIDAEAQMSAPRDGLRLALEATRSRRPRPVWLARPGSRWVSAAPGGERRSLDRMGLEVHWSSALLLAGILLLVLAAGAIAIGALLNRSEPPPRVLGRLAYSLNGDIYLADWDGANATRIADGSSSDGYRFPRWSPDGRHLSYERWSASGEGPHSVFVIDQAGTVLASFPGIWSSWSPDSTTIAVCCSDVFSIDGNHQRHVAEPPGWVGSGDQYAGWTADSRAVVLSMISSGSSPSAAVWAFPLDGGKPRRIAEGYAGPNNRIASPDGTMFVRFATPSLDGSRMEVVDLRGNVLTSVDSESIGEWVFAGRRRYLVATE